MALLQRDHCVFTSIHVFQVTAFLGMPNMDVQGSKKGDITASVFSQIISESLFLQS